MRHSVLRSTFVLVAGVSLMACSADGAASSTTAAPTTGAPSASTAVAAGATTTPSSAPGTEAPTTLEEKPSIRTKRYCEVLLITPKAEGFTAKVFGTFGLNDCPADQWAALDPLAIAKANGVVFAFLNGPRYWLMDSIDKKKDGAFNVVEFGGLKMNELAVLTVNQRLDAVKPYVGSTVDRRTVFTYRAGTTVYELTDPSGAKYVMQSWSQQVDPNLAEADLLGLAARLKLPAGWAYSSRVLTEPLEVVTVDTPATVLQDDLRNSYSLETSG